MQTNFNPDYNLSEHLQHMVNENISALDIIHGEMKNWMYEAQLELEEAQRIEEANDYDDAMESMERKYWEGQTDALAAVYQLTYQLSFAIAEREDNATV
jgi:hypothetical protein